MAIAKAILLSLIATAAPLATVAQNSARKRGNGQNSRDQGVMDRLVDKSIHKLFDRLLNIFSTHTMDLDKTILGKPSQIMQLQKGVRLRNSAASAALSGCILPRFVTPLAVSTGGVAPVFRYRTGSSSCGHAVFLKGRPVPVMLATSNHEPNCTSMCIGGTTGINKELGRRNSLALSAFVAAGSLASTFPSHARTGPSNFANRSLHNRYILIRHGRSTLDDFAWPDGSTGKLLTNPGFKYDYTWGITDEGQQQMVGAARALEEKLDFAGGWIYTSNFQRSYQSAMVLREQLDMAFDKVRTEFSGLLDPRKLGALDLGPQSAMQSVWENDFNDPDSFPPPVPSSNQPRISVDSVGDLYRRALEAITRLENSYFAQDVILVSHADTLSVFYATMVGTPLERHHLDWPFRNGQVRVFDPDIPQSRFTCILTGEGNETVCEEQEIENPGIPPGEQVPGIRR